MDEINNTDLENILRSVSEKSITDKTVISDVKFEGEIGSEQKIFNKCTFEGKVLFMGSSLQKGIRFVNCKFEQGILFSDCHAAGYVKQEGIYYSIEFENSTVQSIGVYGKCSFERGLKISNCELESLQISQFLSSQGGIDIKRTNISDDITFSFVKIKNDFRLAETKVSGQSRITQLFCSSLIFVNVEISRDFMVWAGEIQNITFNDSHLADIFSVVKTKIEKGLTIIGSSFRKHFTVKLHDHSEGHGAIGGIYLANSTFQDKILVDGGEYSKSDLTTVVGFPETELLTEKVEIVCSNDLSGMIDISSLRIGNLKMSGYNSNSQVTLRCCYVSNFSVMDLYNYSSISFYQLSAYNAQSQLTIKNSNLGNMQFYNVDFSSYKKVNIIDSILIDVAFLSIVWFKDSVLNLELDKNTSTSQNREVFRQIKSSLQRSGNQIGSLEFKSKEMKFYAKEFFGMSKWYNLLFKYDTYILCLSKTNNYGQNWFKPVVFAIFFNIFFYGLLVVGISDNLSFNFNLTSESLEMTWNEFMDFKFMFWQIFNPVHNLDKIFLNNKESFEAIVYSIDYIQKLGMAFFIYQVIYAFRKFTRR